MRDLHGFGLMGRWGWRAIQRRRFRGMVAAVCLIVVSAGTSSARAPTNDEIALLVLANQLRAEPRSQGASGTVRGPLVWSDRLAAASVSHSADMAGSSTCFSHDSCNGQKWVDRMTRFYPGWSALGENLGMLYATVEDAQAAWVDSKGHRDNLLSDWFTEFGAGIETGNRGAFYTEDFGSAGPVTVPTIPAAAVLPRLGGGGARRLLMNHTSSPAKAPRSVHALLGSQCVALSLGAGTVGHGTYEASVTPPGGCTPLVFEVVTADGKPVRYPASGAILVGQGSNCAERTTSLPPASCSGGPVATPTPAPTELTALTGLRVRLAESGTTSGRDRVNVQGILRATPDFDPAGGAGSLTVRHSGGRTWSQPLAASCGAADCMVEVGSNRLPSFRARYATSGPALSLRRQLDGTWRFNFWARDTELGTLDGGPVEVTLDFAGTRATGTVEGTLRRRTVTAR